MNRDQLLNPTLGKRVWATFTFTFYTVPDAVEEYCDERVCLFVCLPVCPLARPGN